MEDAQKKNEAVMVENECQKRKMPITFAIQELWLSNLDQSIQNRILHPVCLEQIDFTF